MKLISRKVEDASLLAACLVCGVLFRGVGTSAEWKAAAEQGGSCCKSYRRNKRCLVLNSIAAQPSHSRRPPRRCDNRAISQYRGGKNKQEVEKTHPFFVVYCPVKRASAPSILTQWSFQMLKGGGEGGGGERGRVGWDGGERRGARADHNTKVQAGEGWMSDGGERLRVAASCAPSGGFTRVQCPPTPTSHTAQQCSVGSTRAHLSLTCF